MDIENYSPMTAQEIQASAPLAAFPEGTIQVSKVTAPNQTTLALILDYNAKAASGRWDECAAILNAHPELENCRISSNSFNMVIDEIKAIELFYRSEVKTFIESLAQKTVGINDGGVSSTASYSSAKIEAGFSDLNDEIESLRQESNTAITKIENTESHVLSVGNWTNEAPYTYQLDISTVTSDDTPIISIDIPVAYTADQAKQAKKSYGFIDTAYTEAGRIMFICKSKKPLVDIPVIVKGV